MLGSFAQDNIIKQDGTEIKAKILEVGSVEIRYKKTANLEGPTYTIEKNEVFMIQYANGTSDLFEKKEGQKEEQTRSYDTKELQQDPKLRITIGDGLFRTYGATQMVWANPSLGFDIRQQNRAWGSFSYGGSFGSYNLEGILSEVRIILGVAGTINYYPPVKGKFFKPYITSNVGLGLYQSTNVLGTHYDEYEQYIDYEDIEWTSYVAYYGGGGVGADFMFARNLGMYMELGFFSNALLNAGLSLKF